MITYIQSTKVVLRKLPYTEPNMEFKWWLEDWKEYILSQNYYLYWTEGGVA